MMNIKRYTASDASLWDAFVRGSRNGTFLFERAYMDYHSDRFTDHSLIFTDDKARVIALLPANEKEGCLYSHQGLTYGGFVLSEHTSMEQVLRMFESLKQYMVETGLSILFYKPVPTIYHLCPSQEDIYALWRMGAEIVGCNISCTVPLCSTIKPEVERRRRRGLAKASQLNYRLQEEASLEIFWPIMVENLLDRYQASPVHSLEEMKLLQSRFPNQIRCYLLLDVEGNAQAGAVVFESAQTVHVQYGHATPKGKAEGALDMLYLSLIDRYSQNPRFHYFDFGTSNEEGGRVLNENLIAQKEGFGGRGVACPIYSMKI